MLKEKNTLRVVAAQLNAIVGDISGNTKKIIKNAIYARDKQKADVVVFPELFLTGYSPEDILYREELYQQTKKALKQIQEKVKDIYLIIGLPTKEKNINPQGRFKEKNIYYNSAIVIYNGEIIDTYNKRSLPNASVFDEKRYFTPGTKNCVLKIKGVKIGLLICSDVWAKKFVSATKNMDAELIISINASPFDIQKPSLRKKTFTQNAKDSKTPIIYANLVGGQDEIVFDGSSLVINSDGRVIQEAPAFEENLMPIDIRKSKNKLIIAEHKLPTNTKLDLIYKALVIGVKDFIEKNKIKGSIVSTSGGIDSALTLAIAVDALGKDKVESIYMPSRYSSKLSGKIAAEEAKILGVKHRSISIEPIYKEFLKNLPKKWPVKLENSTKENILARCRGTMLMAFSNKEELLVLSTGNKSELSVGYATLYGDMVGGFCVLKDIPKTLVYDLAKYRNKISQVIPKEAITRAPSAELAKNQKDSDDLPPYPILDEILERYIENRQPIEKIVAAGFSKNVVIKVIKMVHKNEFKRRQAPPGVKITTKAFGRERRYPITSRFDYTR